MVLGRLAGVGGRRVSLRVEAPEGYRLEVHASGGCVEVELLGGGSLVEVEGEAGLLGRVKAERRDGVVAVTVARASARVKALGAGAVAAVVRGGCLRLRGGEGPPLAFLAARATASTVSARVRLARGGGVLVEASATAARIEAAPEAPGDYWLEIHATASSMAVKFDADGVEYQLEGPVPKGVSVEPEKPGSRFKVSARVKARASSIALR